jgi:hypothetical protein
MKNMLPLLVFFALASCQQKQKDQTSAPTENFLKFDIQNLTETEYPDDPDLGFRHADYEVVWFKNGELRPTDSAFDLYFFSKNQDTILFSNFDLLEFIPTVPNHLKGDEYLTRISLVNQEWNRNQVRFNQQEFETSNPAITRVDVARNCLNAYLWEVIAYGEENGKEMPLAHGWFDFPKELYHELFKTKNDLDFESFASALVDWKTPENKVINTTPLRTITDTIQTTFADLSNAMYPLAGARLKKQKEIIYPTSFETMRALQTDSALFATFTPPGFYNKADPRKTQLGRFQKLVSVDVFGLASEKNATEINMTFSDGERTTHFVVGGIDLDKMPKLSADNANSGWKSSMGFGNHPFYETKTEHLAHKCSESKYYAYLSDAENKWLDSHEIGIDGPIIHWDDAQENLLHIWLLSFERHALVGHYTLQLEN